MLIINSVQFIQCTCCEQVFKLWVPTMSCRDEAAISYVTSKNKQYMEIYMQISVGRNSPHPCIIKILNCCIGYLRNSQEACYLDILVGRTDNLLDKIEDEWFSVRTQGQVYPNVGWVCMVTWDQTDWKFSDDITVARKVEMWSPWCFSFPLLS